jgi:hypothetical protein
MFQSATSAGAHIRRRHRTTNVRAYRAVPVALFAVLAVAQPARADDAPLSFGVRQANPAWHANIVSPDTEPLGLAAGKDIFGMHTVTLIAGRRLDEASGFRVELSAARLDRESERWSPFAFRVEPQAPAVVSGNLSYPDFWRARASYWRELHVFDNGGAMWLSTRLTYVLINAGIRTSVQAYNADGAFPRHTLPVPSVGIHWSYRFAAGWSIDAGIEGGYLPWINSLRRDGSVVQFSQTSRDADIGLRYGGSDGWVGRLFLYALDYRQRERSQQIDTSAGLSRYGIGIGVSRRF